MGNRWIFRSLLSIVPATIHCIAHLTYGPLRTCQSSRPASFFVPSVRRLAAGQVMMTVRVEQGKDGKQVEIEAPAALVANLLWFFELSDWIHAEHLRVRL